MDSPQHDRAREVESESAAIGDFIEWAAERKMYFGRFEPDECLRCFGTGTAPFPELVHGVNVTMNTEMPLGCAYCSGSGFNEDKKHFVSVSTGEKFQRLLAEFFGIDYDAYQQEKEDAYKELRAMNEVQP